MRSRAWQPRAPLTGLAFAPVNGVRQNRAPQRGDLFERKLRVAAVAVVLAFALVSRHFNAQEQSIPDRPDSVKFAAIGYFQHPLYSDGCHHGPEVDLPVRLEPTLVKYGVNVVYSGHDHGGMVH